MLRMTTRSATLPGWTEHGCCGIDLPVRFFGLAVWTLLACVALAPRCAMAQQQERKLAERLMQPDMTLGAYEQNKTFGQGKGFRTDSKAQVKEFYFTGRFKPDKEFSTKEFRSKEFGGRDAKFETKEAPTKTNQAADKRFETKSADVKDARESNKAFSTTAYANAKDAQVHGTAQGSIDEEHNKGPKTIDDVRELLNKNK